MKRFSTITIALLLLIILLPQHAHPASAQEPVDKRKIESALLTTPDKCGELCIWTLQPGKQTLVEFQSFAAALVPDVAGKDARGAAEGFYTDGVALHITPLADAKQSSVVDYLYVRVTPAPAQKAGFNVSGFTPAAMIGSLGNPSQAYLLFSKAQLGKSNRFRLLLVYEKQSALYSITGAFQEGRACLTLESADSLTLYRFGSADSLNGYLRKLASSTEKLPLTISATTNQTPADFTRMAQNPAADCLTLR